MYNSMLEVTDVAVNFLWGWCLCSFCGIFLTLRRPAGMRGRDAGEAVSLKGRGSFLRNGWPMWCFWALLKWLSGRLTDPGYNTGFMLLRTILLYAVLFLFLCIFYEGRHGALIFSFATFMAVSEISRFLAFAVSPLGNWVYDLGNRMLEEGAIDDPEVYLRLITIHSFFLQLLMDVLFIALLWGMLRYVGKAFWGGNPALDRAELRFLLLPACTGTMLCVLLRVILVTVEEGQPLLLYDKYPLLTVVVPTVLVLCLCSIVYSVRLFCELRNLHEEKNRSVILGQQLESMEEHLRETERVYAGVRAMKHDMKNQLAVVTELAGRSRPQAELTACLAQLNQTLSALDFPCRTGSAVVDTLVGIKFHEMKGRIPGISFQAEELLIPSGLKISPMDLSLILGNGLDNAIEACDRAEKAGRQPWIRVGTMMKGACFFLELANSFDGRLKLFNGQEFPETLKEDHGRHGIGLQSIKSTALKYHGGVDWKAEEGVFTLTVMLKNQGERQAL